MGLVGKPGDRGWNGGGVSYTGDSIFVIKQPPQKEMKGTGGLCWLTGSSLWSVTSGEVKVKELEAAGQVASTVRM